MLITVGRKDFITEILPMIGTSSLGTIPPGITS